MSAWTIGDNDTLPRSIFPHLSSFDTLLGCGAYGCTYYSSNLDPILTNKYGDNIVMKISISLSYSGFQEYNIGKVLGDNNIGPHYYEFGSYINDNKEYYYILMEQFQITLHDYLSYILTSKQSHIPIKLIKKRIIEKLEAMHYLGIVHNDITTYNIMLSSNDIFFIDFGKSKLRNNLSLPDWNLAINDDYYQLNDAFQVINLFIK